MDRKEIHVRYESATSWFNLMVHCIDPDRTVALPAIKRAHAIADSYLSRLQFRVLKDPVCLSLYQTYQGLAVDLLVWGPKAPASKQEFKDHYDHAEYAFAQQAMKVDPNWEHTVRTFGLIDELFWVRDGGWFVPDQIDVLRDAWHTLSLWQQEIAEIDPTSPPFPRSVQSGNYRLEFVEGRIKGYALS